MKMTAAILTELQNHFGTPTVTSAELHASGAWELDFVENMRASFKRYAAHTNLTPLQQQHLERIAKH